VAAAFIVIAGAATVAVVVWFFCVRTPERSATHETVAGEAERAPERSHFGPADAGSEDEAVPRAGDAGPA